MRKLRIKWSSGAQSRLIITEWLRPNGDWVNLNSDGCSKGNPSLSGGGSVWRNPNGEVIWDQADFFDMQFNMVAECKALLQGLRRCVAEGWPKLLLESDSRVLVYILNRRTEPPWCVVTLEKSSSCWTPGQDSM